MLPGRPTSLWLDTAARPEFPALAGEYQADVAVIGAGIVGITVAALLKEAGRTVALIEGGRVAGRVTGHTTAKVTSQHGLVYADLVRRHGEDTARLYGEANEAALAFIAETIERRGIDCAFERKASYVYTQSRERLRDLEEEAETARRLGLPASMTAEVGLPFTVAGAVRFDDQAQFHPVRYLMPLAQAIPGDGSAVFEGTRVIDIDDDDPCRVITTHGTVSARDVIIATNLPIKLIGGFFTRAFPRAHQVIAVTIDVQRAPVGMFLSVDTPSRSIRSAPLTGEQALLIVVGRGFVPGHGVNTLRLFRELEAFVRAHFGQRSVDYHWQNQDYDSVDRIPMIGRANTRTEHVHVATGFGAWGMTGGTVAARILADAILERANPWAAVFDATRFDVRAGGRTFVRRNLRVARQWLGDRLRPPRLRTTANLARGEGAVVRLGGQDLAVYKDDDGKVIALSPDCSHLGCRVSWNAAERTWDCGCHGSRFTGDGQVLNGPAVRGLSRRRLPG